MERFVGKIYILFALSALALLAACGGRRGREDVSNKMFVDTLLRSNMNLLYTSPARADSLFSDAQQRLSDSIAWNHLELFRAVAHAFQGDTSWMQDAYRRVGAYCSSHPEAAALEGQLWNHRGVHCSQRGNLAEAVACYQRASQAFERGGERVELISANINLADASFLSGRLPDAAKYYRRALFVADSLGASQDLLPIYSGLGQVYSELANFDEAHRYFGKASALLGGASGHEKFHYYLSLGNCLYFENRYAQAREAFLKAYAIARRQSDPLSLAQCEGNLGEVALLLGLSEEAASHIRRCEAFVAANPSADPSVVFYLKCLSAALALSEDRLPDDGRLLAPLADSVAVAVPRYLMLHYERLARYAYRKGDYRKAFEYKERADRYKDSLVNCHTLNNVIEMGERYKQDTTLLKQRLTIASYAARTSRQQAYIAVAVSGLVVLALAIGVVLFVLRRREEARHRRQLEQVTRLRMEIVRNRVSPHYVFNVLGTVLPKFRAYPELFRPMELLIDVLRGSLLVAERNSVTLEEEMAFVRRFVELRCLTSGLCPAVRWHVDAPCPLASRVPAMCLQIPVENALKHAFPSPSSDNAVDISISLSESGLRLCVEDNGAGYCPGKVPATGRDTGTGLRMLSRTVALFNKDNVQPIRFSIGSRPAPQEGTAVVMKIPTGYRFPED